MRTGVSTRAPDVRASRSKGCLSCRRRKVKCDERHPTCERCEKGSHKCLGYEQPFIFVHQVPRYPGTTSVPAPAPCSSSKPKAKPTENPTTKHENDHRQRVLAKAKANSPPSTLATVSSVGFPRTRLDLRGFQDEIVIAHLLSKFTIGFGHDMPRGTDAPTMGAVLTSRNSKSSAYLSGLGLAQAFFGRLYKDDGMIRQSALLYGKALTSLRGDLQLANLEEVRSRAYLHLWTSVFLGLYEIVSSAGSSNWLQHSMGVSALTEMLGPEAFQSCAANDMLESYRPFMAVPHVIQRRRCFLEQPAWKRIPWAGPNAPAKTLTSQLHDVLCDIPGLMEDVDAMLESEKLGHDASFDKFLLQDKVLNSINQIAVIRWQWEAMYPKACTETPTTPGSCLSTNDQGQPLFPTYLEFEDMDRAADVLSFNAYRLMLYALSDSVGLTDMSILSNSQQCNRKGPGSNPLVLPGQGDRVAHALEICRTAEYMMQARRESQGLLTLFFPLRVAYTHLQGLPEVAVWIQQVMEKSSSRGFKLGEHVLKIKWDPLSRR